ncbi:hypothetical protein KVH22_30045 [Streptomyces olivaceus]|uniref:hypothetical protein n=1 Tax=Streptomyces olivaceus TaxID=47716 RepID=UPI001CCA7044|nr:hypothetical protein [Streptomyces olivaceus]MBZ6175598.1 hypothetical protein [Streptomyces olivaceus]MBZ6181860.1 hypothetical protein [Streptomyces olivaceus]MBZ6259762.1 hypothetical protein [Streptomyces olivaceus]
MSRVVMIHPDLPDQPIDVDEVSIPHYQASGWQVDDNPPAIPVTKARAAKRRRQTGDES